MGTIRITFLLFRSVSVVRSEHCWYHSCLYHHTTPKRNKYKSIRLRSFCARGSTVIVFIRWQTCNNYMRYFIAKRDVLSVIMFYNGWVIQAIIQSFINRVRASLAQKNLLLSCLFWIRALFVIGLTFLCMWNKKICTCVKLLDDLDKWNWLMSYYLLYHCSSLYIYSVSRILFFRDTKLDLALVNIIIGIHQLAPLISVT